MDMYMRQVSIVLDATDVEVLLENPHVGVKIEVLASELLGSPLLEVKLTSLDSVTLRDFVEENWGPDAIMDADEGGWWKYEEEL